MKLKVLIAVIGVLLLATAASALTLQGRCDIHFSGQSTLHDFDGMVACQPFTLTSDALPETAGSLRQPVIKVMVGEMNTDNTSRDKKMRAMFEEEKYPEIQGLFDDIDPERLLRQWQEKEETSGTLEFDLQIRQVKQRVTATTENLLVTPEQISFVLSFPVSLASFQLKPPSVLGFIKVDDQVQVEVQVILLQQ